MSGQQRTLVRDQCVHGRDIDDLAVTAFAHVRYDVFADQISTPHVGIHLFVPFIGGQLLDSTRHGDTRIVEQNVDLSKASHDLPDRFADLLLVGHVAPHDKHFTPRCGYFVGYGLQFLDPASQQCHVSSLTGISPGCIRPQTARRTGYDSNPSRQIKQIIHIAFDISTTIPASCLLRTRTPTDAAPPADYSRTPSVKTVWCNDDSTAAYLYGCSSSGGIVQPARSGKPELRRSPRYIPSPSGYGSAVRQPPSAQG